MTQTSIAQLSFTQLPITPGEGRVRAGEDLVFEIELRPRPGAEHGACVWIEADVFRALAHSPLSTTNGAADVVPCAHADEALRPGAVGAEAGGRGFIIGSSETVFGTIQTESG